MRIIELPRAPLRAVAVLTMNLLCISSGFARAQSADLPNFQNETPLYSNGLQAFRDYNPLSTKNDENPLGDFQLPKNSAEPKQYDSVDIPSRKDQEVDRLFRQFEDLQPVLCDDAPYQYSRHLRPEEGDLNIAFPCTPTVLEPNEGPYRVFYRFSNREDVGPFLHDRWVNPHPDSVSGGEDLEHLYRMFGEAPSIPAGVLSSERPDYRDLPNELVVQRDSGSDLGAVCVPPVHGSETTCGADVEGPHAGDYTTFQVLAFPEIPEDTYDDEIRFTVLDGATGEAIPGATTFLNLDHP